MCIRDSIYSKHGPYSVCVCVRARARARLATCIFSTSLVPYRGCSKGKHLPCNMLYIPCFALRQEAARLPWMQQKATGFLAYHYSPTSPLNNLIVVETFDLIDMTCYWVLYLVKVTTVYLVCLLTVYMCADICNWLTVSFLSYKINWILKYVIIKGICLKVHKFFIL